MAGVKELICGIYRVYLPDGEAYIGFSHNVEGTLKRLRFELTLNACPYRQLQKLWNDNGNVEMELLEEYHAAPGMSDEEKEAHLLARLLFFKQKLGAKLLQTQQPA